MGTHRPPASTRRTPILAFDNNEWFADMKNRQQLLGRLSARGWPVTYSNGPLDVWERHTPSWAHPALFHGHKTSADGVRVDRPGLVLARYRRLHTYDDIAVRLHLRHLRSLSGIARARDFVLFLFNPAYLTYVERLQPRWVVFHVRDVFAALPHHGAGATDDLAALAARADLLTVPSPGVIDTLPPAVRAKTRTLPNAADAELFARGADCPVPPDLAEIPRPRIGYIGALSLKFDFRLVSELARRQPRWHWVLIGPQPRDSSNLIGGSECATQAWTECLANPNVHFLGPRPYASLPAYAAAMDVNTIPYDLESDGSQWARYAVPLKLHEYLAAGPPVVSCDLPFIREHSAILAIATTPTRWETELARALDGQSVSTPAQRRAVALANTWDARADQLDIWLRELTGQHDA